MDGIANIVSQNHFVPKAEDRLHIVFLREKPAKSQVDTLKHYNSPADEFAVIGREVYNLRREMSVFSNNFIEKIFGTATTRNVNTLKKIFEKYR